MFNLPKAKALVLGESIEYICAGSGPMTVVLVNGSGGPIEGWHKVFAPLAGFSKVFAYNRPGTGKSSKPIVPQVGSHMVALLRGVLLAANLPAPYVLVGHSLGGLIVNHFARLYPSEVSAVVLLEATAPKDIQVLATHESAVQRYMKKFFDWLAPPHPNAETQHLAATLSELQLASAFPAIPLVVVTGCKPAMAWATPPQALSARAAHQLELASLSPLGKQVLATRSGHFPQLSEPDLVVSTIKEAIGG